MRIAQWFITRKSPIAGITFVGGAFTTIGGAVYFHAGAVASPLLILWAALQLLAAEECLAPRFDSPISPAPHGMTWAPLGPDSLLLHFRDRQGRLRTFLIQVPAEPFSMLRAAHNAAIEEARDLHDLPVVKGIHR